MEAPAAAALSKLRVVQEEPSKLAGKWRLVESENWSEFLEANGTILMNLLRNLYFF
jgi:hypothetical protein